MRNATILTAATYLLATPALAAAADVVILDVMTAMDTWAETHDFSVDGSDQDDASFLQLAFAFGGETIDANASINGTWGNGHAHANADVVGHRVEVFGDSSAYASCAEDQLAKGSGVSANKVIFELNNPCRVVGQFCVRGNDEGGSATASMYFYNNATPNNMLAQAVLAQNGDVCVDFDIVVPAGEYVMRSGSTSEAEIYDMPGFRETWSQFGGEIEFIALSTPDINGDGVVDGYDLARFLAQWGTNNSDFDFNGDGVVDGADLAIMFGAWG